MVDMHRKSLVVLRMEVRLGLEVGWTSGARNDVCSFKCKGS